MIFFLRLSKFLNLQSKILNDILISMTVRKIFVWLRWYRLSVLNLAICVKNIRNQFSKRNNIIILKFHFLHNNLYKVVTLLNS